MKLLKRLPFLDRISVVILLVVFGGVVIHAPLSVSGSVLLPDFELIVKSWKEILLVIASVLTAASLIRSKRLNQFTSDKLLWLILAFALVHVLLALVPQTGLAATLAGLAIDLRFTVFFGLVYVYARLYPELRRVFLYVFAGGVIIVTMFALLQVFVLPIDVLRHLGYGPDTIQPYLTIDRNYEYVRINSTLRGPNPLGAYMVVVVSVLSAYLAKLGLGAWPAVRKAMFALISFGALVALWFSYSRSALVAGGAALGIIFLATVARRFSPRMWVVTITLTMGMLGGLLASSGSEFVSNVVFHENPSGGSATTSNQEHIDSLHDGFERMISQPLGAGVGSTGSASLFTDQPLIIENQYFFIAHEVGWLGLGLFLIVMVAVFYGLWQHRQDWLSLAVLASGVGLSLVGLLLPVWVDDTVSIIWWGLAGLALGSKGGE